MRQALVDIDKFVPCSEPSTSDQGPSQTPPDSNNQEPLATITKAEMELVVRAYDNRKQSASTKQGGEPVKCDEVKGGSYAKLLFSKPRFHDPASSRQLIKELNIKDVGRDSLLCGQSSYIRSAEDKLESLIEVQRDSYLRVEAKRVYNLISGGNTGDGSTITDAIERLIQLNDTSGDALAVRGKWALHLKNYDQAIADLGRALTNECWDRESIALDLAKAYYQQSVLYYAKGDYPMALNRVEGALMFDNKLVEAQLHRGLCLEKLNQRNRPFGVTPDPFTSRRK